MYKFTALTCVILTSFLTGCLDSQYGTSPSSSYPYPNSYPYPQNQYPNAYPNGYPNGYPNNGYPGNVYPNGYPAGAYQSPPPYYPPRQNNNYPNNHYPNNNPRHGNNNNRPPANNAVIVPVNPRPVPQAITPSCPAGTNYNGRTCVITDNRLRKPGGDGNINPCPKGMWNSNGKCIKG